MTSLALPAASQALAALQKSLGPLDAQAAGLLVAAATDLSLVIDGEGIVRDATFGSSDLEGEGCETWLGRPWIDTVTIESRPKITALLKDAAPGAVTRWRQVNHVSPTGTDLPVRYAAMRLAEDGKILVLGRNLRAMASLQRTLAETQQALERDYLRMRGAETRYRLLFQLGSEPVLVVDAGTRRVTEVNPAAARLIGRADKRILGHDAVDLFDHASLRDLVRSLDAKKDEAILRTFDGVTRCFSAVFKGAAQKPTELKSSAFRIHHPRQVESPRGATGIASCLVALEDHAASLEVLTTIVRIS